MILPTGYTFSPKLSLLYIAMERCGSKHVRNCMRQVDPQCEHNYDIDCFLPDYTDNLLAVMRNPTKRLVSIFELMYLTDREPPNYWFTNTDVTPPWMPTTRAGADEIIKCFEHFALQLNYLNEQVQLDRFVRPQCHWYTRSDIEYIDISEIETHLGITKEVPIEVERKTSITYEEYMNNETVIQNVCEIYEEDFLKLDYNPVPSNQFST